MWWTLFGDWLFGYFCTAAADKVVGKVKRPPSVRALEQAMRAAKDVVIDNVPDTVARERLADAFKRLEFRRIKIVADARTAPGEQVRQALLESLAPLIRPGESGPSVAEESGLTPEWLSGEFLAAVTLAIGQISSGQSLSALAAELDSSLLSGAVADLSRELRDWKAESTRWIQAVRANAALYFAGELGRLRRYVVQPSYAQLADVTGTTPDYVAAVLAGNAALPDWSGFCEPLIAFCRDLAVQARIVSDPDVELGSMRAWQDFWTLAEEGAAGVWLATPMPLPEDGPEEKTRSKDRQAETRRRKVLEGAGLAVTLRNLYPQYRLVELWGIPMPICVFPA